MKIILVLLSLAIFISIPSVFAQPFQNIEHGKNYDREYLGLDNQGNVIYFWRSAPERLLDGLENGKPVYVDYKITENTNNIVFEAANNSYTFNKQTCSFSVYDGGKIAGQDQKMTLSHTIKEAQNGTDVWHSIAENNLACSYTMLESDTKLQINATRGSFTTVYDINLVDGFEWTYVYPNNNPVKTDHKYGFTLVCDGEKCDDIRFGDVFLNQTQLTKQELGNKKLSVGNQIFDTKNNIHDYLWVVKKQDNKMIADFTHSKGRLEVGQTLIVDPSFSSNNPTVDDYISTNSATGAACPNSSYSKNEGTAHMYLYAEISSVSGGCLRTYSEFPISSIPNNAIITSANLTVYVNLNTNARNIDITQLASQPSTRTAAQVWSDIGSGTVLISNSAALSSTGSKTLDLGSTGVSNIQAALPSDWVGYGIKFRSESRDTSEHMTRMDTEEGSNDPVLSVVYLVPLNPPDSFTASSNARKAQFTWTQSNGLGIQTYYIGRSLDNSTWPAANKTSTGNVTSYLSYAYWKINQLYYVNITAGATGINSTSKYTSFTTDNFPSAPTSQYATGTSDTSIIIRWNPPTSNGNDAVTGYKIQYCTTCSSWSTLVNSTNTYNYNHTGLVGGPTITYRMAAWNGVGLGDYTANFTGKTWTKTTGTLTLTSGIVGDVIQVNSTITITEAIPSPVTVSLLRMFVNGTLVGSQPVSVQIASGGSSSNFNPFWYQMTSEALYQIQVRATISNVTGNVVFNSTVNQQREYGPDYFTAVVASQGLVNYTENRISNGEILNLKVNRDKGGNTFQIECYIRDTWEAIKDEPGTWYNSSGIGYYNATIPVDGAATIYFDCYNDELLFSSSSYGNNTENPLLTGIALFDQFGGLMGAQAVVIIIIGIFAMADGKNSPQILVLGMIVCGILAGLNLLVFNQAMWGMLMAASAVGLFAMKRYYF